ncbi:alpha/beta-hydrolase [Agrocybe pediades]|nr:alpha/beta-hydrolase [Agrocybe pediades]
MTQEKAPYGTWKSPINALDITKGANSIADLLVDRSTSEVYHLESRPSEKGRNVLVHTVSKRDIVGPGWNVRTGVQEYGGAAAIVSDGVAYFSNLDDGRVYRVEVGEKSSEPAAITPEGKPFRFAAFEVHPLHSELLVAVLEDHTKDVPSEIVNTLVVINVSQKTIHPLLSGADFYAQPTFSPDGQKFAWLQWNHPDMPWHGAELYIADVSISDDKILTTSKHIHVAGVHSKVSAQYPAWKDNDTLVYISDESGFMNPWKFSIRTGKSSALFPNPVQYDFGYPLWVLGFFPYAIIGDQGVFTAMKDGRSQLYIVDINQPSSPTLLLPNPYVSIAYVRSSSSEGKKYITFAGQKSTSKPVIVRMTFTHPTVSSNADVNFEILKESDILTVNGSPLPEGIISIAQPVTLKKPSGDPLYAVYYPPNNPAYSGSSIEGEKPPCIVHVHGGPTGLQEQGLDWKTQYFTSRGWAWLSVNYGGSSGYGREYIERLDGNWGIVDVEDCILAPQLLASPPHNLIDPNRLLIRGGSAGGFTTLAAISIASDLKVFAAANAFFGVSDLTRFAESTHKFESRYLDHLMGGSVKDVPGVYWDRSPINHADKIVTPLLILQGDIDKVVPKDQAETIYESVRKRGGVVEYKLYPGEGHGWRKEETMRDALERELGFYERVLGLNTKDKAHM